MNSMLRDVLFVLAVFGVLMDVLQCDAGKTPGSDNDAAAIVISALHSQPGDNNSGLAVAQNIVPTPKFVKCRPLKTDYSIRNDPNQIKQLLEREVDAFMSRTGKAENQSGNLIQLPVDNAVMNGGTVAFRATDLDFLRELLYYREQHPQASVLDLEMDGKGNSDVAEAVVEIAKRIDIALLTANQDSINQKILEEMKSYETTASVLLRDSPLARDANFMKKYRDATDSLDTEADFCNLLQIMVLLRKIVEQISVKECGQGSDTCSPSILNLLLNNFRRTIDFKNVICLSNYGNTGQCANSLQQTNALSKEIWDRVQSFVDYITESKICNSKKCDYSLEEIILYLALTEQHIIHEHRMNSQPNGVKIPKEPTEIEAWIQIATALQNMKSYGDHSSNSIQAIDDCLKWIQELLS